MEILFFLRLTFSFRGTGFEFFPRVFLITGQVFSWQCLYFGSEFVVLVELMAVALQASALADCTELSGVPCLGAVSG